ncbi:MAG: hypothetical protein LUG45_11480 [Clostridiales bacterium]|nr:hypothetical protein [Clostridiales bacterium]
MGSNAPILCGAARRCITPPMEWLPQLRGLQDVTFTEVLDDLYVRALALRAGADTVLIICFDCDKVPCPQANLDAVTAETGIPATNISLLAIHSHTAPIGGWRPNEGPNFILRKPVQVQEATHRYEAFLQERLLEAVGEALDALRPARLGWGNGESYINVSRVQDYYVTQPDGSVAVQCGLGRDFSAPVDRRLFVLKAEGLDGTPIAFLTNYAVHNCVMIRNRCGRDGGTLLSSDLGGNVSQMLERAYPGAVALWTSGAAGDVNPILSNEIFYPDPTTGVQTQYILPAGESAPLMMLNTLAAQHYADTLRVIRSISCDVERGRICSGVAWAETPGRDGNPYRVRVHLTGIGPLWMAGVSGELYTSLGRAVLEQLPADAIVQNHDGSLLAESGYIYDDAILARDTEGVLPGRHESQQQPGYIRTALQDAVETLYARLSGGEGESGAET